MLLNVDQLQKQLDKDEFQEDGSMTAFWVVNNQFQKFIDSKFTLDYDSQMTDTYFVEYTGIEVQHFRDTLLQHLGNVKKSVAERTRHQRQYERRVNKRQMQTQESKIHTGKAVDNGLVVMESNGTESEVQDDSSRSGNDTDADDADIRPSKSSVRIQSIRQENSHQPIDQKNHTQKPGRQIFTGHRFSLNKTSAVYEKTSPRSDLRWKPTDILNIHECKQTLDVSAGTSINVQKEQSLDLSACTLCNVNKENLRVWLLKKLISQKPLSKWIHK
ncbi:hypothetical protein Tco_1056473 [Tanacetum coccineum]|uniref:Uncharacterized protein n=1 Tax=Tanacetum coccineum TaxID=301880 RepID=A0ABQ5H2Q4_9ASTR